MAFNLQAVRCVCLIIESRAIRMFLAVTQRSRIKGHETKWPRRGYVWGCDGCCALDAQKVQTGLANADSIDWICPVVESQAVY